MELIKNINEDACSRHNSAVGSFSTIFLCLECQDDVTWCDKNEVLATVEDGFMIKFVALFLAIEIESFQHGKKAQNISIFRNVTLKKNKFKKHA